jgi:acylglycerol lipase
MTARHEDGRLPVSGQYWQAWTPSGPVRGVVVLVHGAHEHSGRYAHVAETLGAAGFAVHAVDHPGHGRSAGTRGNIGSMAQTVAGVDQVARAAQQRHAGAPTFVYGHSLGGLIALQYLTGDPVPLAGAVISAPAVDLSAASAVQIRLAGLLSRLTPNLGVVQLEAAAVSRDPEVVRDYTSDPLNNMGKVRARTGAEMLATVRAMPARVPQLRLPLYLLHGTADRLVPVTATEWLAANTGSADVTVRTWDGLYHEPHNEPERGQVLAEIVDWLQAHLDRPA